MLRFSAIATLVFYITISIGVHVDVDTCCNSIAGFSIISDSDSHPSSAQDCCPTEQSTCCSSDSNMNCELDCIYLQMLSEEQLISNPPKYSISEIEILDNTLPTLESDQRIREYSLENINAPPNLAINESLHLYFKSLTTYG